MSPRGAPRAFVGNDVVDLADPRCAGKAHDGRFLDRIFDQRERRNISEARHPDRTLWRCWAAKEAAFKVMSKVLGSPPPFEHAAFGVRWNDRREREGTVHYRDRRVPVMCMGNGLFGPVHVLSWNPDPPSDLESDGLRPGIALVEPDAEVPDVFTPQELKAIHGPASAWVRIRAREHLASLVGVEEDALEIVCPEGATGRTPPHVLLRGHPCPWDVSLSHHGRYVGWALRGPLGPNGAERLPG